MIKGEILHKIKKGIKRVAARVPMAAGPANSSSSLPCIFSIDSPQKAVVDKKRVVVEGWLIPEGGRSLKGMRVLYGGRQTDLPFGLKRQDVARAYPDRDEDAALMSGFSLELDTQEGALVVEVDLGDGYKRLYSIDLHYSPERTVKDLYNPDLPTNWAEHLNLMENRRAYFYEPSQAGGYKRGKEDPRLLAFYLPQYHPIPENDKAWGKGFTEWTNVSADTPRFLGHQQPFLPGDLGFYDLRREEVMEEQIDLAKKHGIYGFCFYYYWFSGERLLEMPIDNFLRHKEWDFNFIICWANENWTQRWDGRETDVIMAQQYLPDDPLRFIKDVEDTLLDPRYIHQDGKPVLAVFRASELKQPEEYARVWREYFKKKHGKELYLLSMISFEDKDPRSYGFDAAVDFAPQSAFFKNDAFKDGKYPYLGVNDKLIDVNFEGTVADYRQLALNEKTYDYFPFPTHKCVTPSWDNDARKKGKGFVLDNVSPDIYGQWLDGILGLEAKKTSSPLVFINAWNEWAEGTTLEPTRHTGHAVINRTTEVLAKYSSNKDNQKQFPLYGIVPKKQGVEIAVVLHLFYPEKWELIKGKIQDCLTEKYDLFVTINEKDRDFIGVIKDFRPDAQVFVVPNRGRDVLPFVHLARRISSQNYKYVLKLHSKKSKHREDGVEWFEELLGNLLPGKVVVKDIIARLDEDRSLVGPEGHYLSLERYMGADAPHIRRLLGMMDQDEKAEEILSRPGDYGYFGGTMFWAHFEVIKPLLALHLLPDDFESERGQIDGTLAHGIERLLSLLPQISGKPLYRSSANGVVKVKPEDADRDYRFAP